jgi:hypothetical protein
MRLGLRRRAVLGRPALDDIGDEEAALRIDPGLQEHGVQKLSRAAHESAADPVLFGARSFSEEKQLGRWVPAVDNQVSPAAREAAKPAVERRKPSSEIVIALRGENGGLGPAHFNGPLMLYGIFALLEDLS